MISASPERYTFQEEMYKKRTEEAGEDTSDAYLEFWAGARTEKAMQEADPKWQKNNLEYDLRTTQWVLDKARTSKTYAQHIYAALCNTQWCKRDTWQILTEQYWTCSWRYAGGVVADMIGKGDYVGWYCSGLDIDGSETPSFVREGHVTEEIAADLSKLGWFSVPFDDNNP